MKKRFNLLLLILLLVSFIPLSVYGEDDEQLLGKSRMMDSAGILTEEQTVELRKKLDKISKKQNFDIIIATVDSLDMVHTAAKYADILYDSFSFGMGNNNDGILFLISMEERDWAISTSGFGITAFTDAGQKYMVDNFVEYLSEGNYYKAFDKFADLSDDFITQAKTGRPYDGANLPKKPMSPIWILVSILGGAVVGFVSTGIMKSSLKSVSKQKVASKYIVSTDMSSFANKDLYLYSRVTKREKPKERRPVSTGSTTRRSASGRRHGGSSGKF